MSYVESGNDLIRFMLSLGFVTVPAVEVEPFEFGIFNHKKRLCGQSRGKLDRFDLCVDEGVAVVEAEGLDAVFADHGGQTKQFCAQLLGGFNQGGEVPHQ